MAWSNTNKVGCGITEFIDGKWFAKLYTCNYGPAGNYIGGQMVSQQYLIPKSCLSIRGGKYSIVMIKLMAESFNFAV